MYERILVATDGSPLSKKAVTQAIGLAATCGAELIAVKVVPRYPQAYFEGSIPLNAKDVARIEAQWAEEAQAAVAAVQKTALAKGLKPKLWWCAQTLCPTPSLPQPKNTKPIWWSWPRTVAKASNACCWAARHSKC